MIVTLSDFQDDYAAMVARRRREAAVEKDRPARNGCPEDPEKAFAYDLLGARCECAAYIALKPCKWNRFSQRVDDLPDIDDWIDVKGSSKAWYDLPIQKKGKPHWGYLLVCSHGHPNYKLVGWAWGSEGMLRENWRTPPGGYPAFFLGQKRLRPLDDLIFEMRRRQAEKANGSA